MSGVKMRRYEAYKQKALREEPGVKEAYDALQPEFDINQAIIDARNEQNLTHQKLSQNTWSDK